MSDCFDHALDALGSYDNDSFPEYSGGVPQPKPLKDFFLIETDTETKKAKLFLFRDDIAKCRFEVWLPKSALVRPHLDMINAGWENLVWKNIKQVVTNYKNK